GTLSQRRAKGRGATPNRAGTRSARSGSVQPAKRGLSTLSQARHMHYGGRTLTETYALPFQFGLNIRDPDFCGGNPVFHRDGGSYSGALARDGAAHHVADGGMRNL